MSRCTLLYRAADSNNWLPLQGLGGTNLTVKNVPFDDGLLTQSEAGNETKRIVRVSVRGRPSVKVSDGGEIPVGTQFDVEAVCDKFHVLSSPLRPKQTRADVTASLWLERFH